MPMILDEPELPTYLSNAHERRIRYHSADALIVGAGILGTALAVTLARQGRSVLLLEKSWKEPDRIVGELLQPGGVAALKELGLEECLEDIDAIQVKGYNVIFNGENCIVGYDTVKSAYTVRNGKRAAPEGRSFHHGRFVGKLRAAAIKEDNVTVVETTAVQLISDGHHNQILGVECLTQGKPDYYFADLTIIADGYASKFRSPTSSVVSSSKFYGLELKDADLPSPQHGHVVLSDTAPVLLYQIGTHETRVLVDVPTNCATASVASGGVKNHLRNVVLPALPATVQPSFKAALDEGKLRSMPNSFLPPRTNKQPGLCILGDAMNMRHPLTGGGMTVAFNDVVHLRTLLSPSRIQHFSDTNAVLAALRAFHWQRKGLSSVINILAMALYALFAADDNALRVLQNGCFRYFQLGGACVSGPVGLLSGLTHNPLILLMHFFAVAIYGMVLYVIQGTHKQSRALFIPLRLVNSLTVFWKACVVIIPYILTETRV